MYHEESTTDLKDKIFAVLHELKFRKAFAQDDYVDILNVMDSV